MLGSATYCTRCVGSGLGADGAAFASLALADSISPSLLGAEPSAPANPDTPHWLIIVARDQPDLFAHLTQSFAREDKVEVILDRRVSSEAHPRISERLRFHGVAVVKRHWH